MEDIYKKAIEIEAKEISPGKWSTGILPFTAQAQRLSGYHYLHEGHQNPWIPRQSRQRRPTRRARLIETEYDNPDEEIKLLGRDLEAMRINNINIPQNYGVDFRGRQFGRGRQNFVGQGRFIDKKDARCYNCQEKGHFASECPKTRRSMPRTASMNRSRSRTRKFNEQNQRQRSRSRGRYNNQKPRSRSRGRNQRNYRRNNNQRPIDQTQGTQNNPIVIDRVSNTRYVNNVEYDDEIYTPGYRQNNYTDSYQEEYYPENDDGYYDDQYNQDDEYHNDEYYDDYNDEYSEDHRTHQNNYDDQYDGYDDSVYDEY